MRIEIIPNRGPASMGSELGRAISWCSSAHLATAFLTPAGLRKLKSFLVGSENGKGHKDRTVKLMVGLYNRFTPPEVLRDLLRLQNKMPNGLEVRVSRNPKFHWKCYLFRKGASARTYVGSANLTSDGLQLEGELCLKLTISTETAIARSLEEEFDRLWQRDSFPLNEKVVSAYNRLSRPQGPLSSTADDSVLAKLLRRLSRPAGRRRRTKAKSGKRLYVRPVYINDFFGKETQALLSSRTDWDRRGYDYTSEPSKQVWEKIRKNKYFLMVECSVQNRNAFSVSFKRVVDSIQLKTPDGNYFFAHRRVAHSQRKRFRVVKEKFHAAGIGLKALSKGRVLKQSHLECIFGLLKVPVTVQKEIQGA